MVRRTNANTEKVSQPEPGYGTSREAILKQAMRITHHDRNASYGDPENNFQHIANFWNDYLAVSGREANITPNDVAIFMILMKTARLGNNPSHWDSTVDIAGYAACLGDCQAGAAATGINGCADTVLR